MGGKIRLSHRTKRYLGATIAAAVTTLIGLNLSPKAEAQTCSLNDAMQWQLALSDPGIEQTPDHIREATEAFISACPDRPEIPDAHRVAGMAAADMDDAAAAAKHFKRAAPMQDLSSNFYAMASFLAVGESRAAWRLRDTVVERWRSRLDRHPHVLIDSEATEHGMIYSVSYTQTQPSSGPSAAWIAVPFDAGWPATLSFSNRDFRVALRKARGGEAAQDNRYVDFNRCHQRRSIGQLSASVSSVDFDASAKASLIAYLADPDGAARAPDSPQPCFMPSRLLPNTPSVAP